MDEEDLGRKTYHLDLHCITPANPAVMVEHPFLVE
jgi:hypothetical protein